MTIELTDVEKRIIRAFSFDFEVTIEGKKRISPLAQRLIAAIYSEADSDDLLAHREISSEQLRLRICRAITGTRNKEKLASAIKEAIDHGLLYKRSPYVCGKNSFGYAISSKFLKGQKIWTKNPKNPDLKGFEPVNIKFSWQDKLWDMAFLNDLSLDESVVELLEVYKDDPKRLNRLAYDVRRIIRRKHYISEGNTHRITMLTNQICSDLRGYLTYNGKRLVEGDIKTCHPTLLAWVYQGSKDEGAIFERQAFIEYIDNPKNDFYSIFMDRATSRDEAKTNFNAWLNGSANQVTYEALHQKFPILAERISRMNTKEKTAFYERREEFRITNKLNRAKANERYKECGMKRVVGCVIQMLEASIVCRQCFKYALEHGTPFLPIHDGFQCLPEDYNSFTNMIVEGFSKKAGVRVRVETTPETKEFQSMKTVEHKGLKMEEQKINSKTPKARRTLAERLAANPPLRLLFDVRKQEFQHKYRMPPPEWYIEGTWKRVRLEALEGVRDEPELRECSDEEILQRLDQLPPGWRIDIAKRPWSSETMEYLRKSEQIRKQRMDQEDFFGE